MKKVLLVVALLAGFLSSCGDDEVVFDPLKTGQAYYPVVIGNYWIYNVTETKYVNNVGQTTTLQTRELVKGVFKDQTGKEWYTVEVSQRKTPNNAWVITGAKSISKTVNDLQIQENNRTDVFMVFPVSEGKEWNPNAFNKDYNFEEEPQNQTRFKYKDVGMAFEKSGKSYEKTAIIQKAENINIYSLDERYEVLALEIGPVFKVSKAFVYCNTGNTFCEIGEDFIVSGLERIEELESTGKI